MVFHSPHHLLHKRQPIAWTDDQLIHTRRHQPQEDVISYLIEKGYRNREILTECVTYAAAGMVTTREFICVAPAGATRPAPALPGRPPGGASHDSARDSTW